MKISSICLLFALSLCACTTADRQLAEQFAITYGVDKVIENNPTLAPRIIVIADQIDTFVDTDASFTVAELSAFISSKINWGNLSKADTDLIKNLLHQINLRLVDRIGIGQISPDRRLTIKQFTSWIRLAAST